MTWIDQIVLVRRCNKATPQVLAGCVMQFVTVVVTYIKAKSAILTTSIYTAEDVIRALIFDAAREADACLQHW